MFSKRIEEARTIAIGGHVRPDGDCTGSCMGMYNYLRENYPEKTVDVYLEEIPEAYKFLQGTKKIRHEIPRNMSYDLFLCLDCGDQGRLGFRRLSLKRQRIHFVSIIISAIRALPRKTTLNQRRVRLLNWCIICWTKRRSVFLQQKLYILELSMIPAYFNIHVLRRLQCGQQPD